MASISSGSRAVAFQMVPPWSVGRSKKTGRRSRQVGRHAAPDLVEQRRRGVGLELSLIFNLCAVVVW
jgi:hypothetical protein